MLIPNAWYFPRASLSQLYFSIDRMYTHLLVAQKQDAFSLAVQATENHFNGRTSVELHGLDICSMIITIDGPTASGKSTVARLLAEQLGYLYINSGLLFRGLAYILIKRTHTMMASDKLRHDDHKARIALFEKVIAKHPELIDIRSIEAIILKEEFHYRFVKDKGPEVFIRHEHITPFLKSPDIDQVASIIGTHAAVRQVLLDYQRELANNHDVVADGRDCGTVSISTRKLQILPYRKPRSPSRKMAQ